MKFNQEIFIGDRKISRSSATFIIAEAGVNHNGDISLAKKLVDVAVYAKVDAIKFQSFKTESLILANVSKAGYQMKTTDAVESQFEMLKKLEITIEQTKEIQDYCQQKGIIFLTTPFDEISLEELDKLNVPAYKIASTDLTNISFIRKVALRGKPIILSTGMSYMAEVKKVVSEIHMINKDLIILQCVANYPIKDNEANLGVINSYMEEFDALIGYSDHTAGPGASPYAVAMGCKVVEKHFTLDKNSSGPDHLASLDPDELLAYVKEIRKVEQFIGSGEKLPTDSELNTRKKLQKCLVANDKISKGEVFNLNNMIAKRTGGIGIGALRIDDIAGEIATRDYEINDIIEIA